MSSDLYQLASLLLFLPGIALFEILNERFQLRMPLLERLVGGALTWNFVFGSTSVLLGFSPPLLSMFFWTFGSVSIFLLLLFLILRLKAFKEQKVVHPDSTDGGLMCFSYLLPIVLISSIIAMFTPVYSDWDVWAIWLPFAKSIAFRGDLLFHEYFLTIEAVAAIPPNVPLIYAWVYSITGGDYYRLIPVTYYVLLGFATYLLSTSIFESKRIALGATIVSMSSLITLATLFGFTMNPDLPTAFFMCTSMTYLVRILKGDTKKQNLLLLGASLSLLMLTRVIGLYFTYFSIVFALLFTHIPHRKAFFAALFFLPFFVLTFNAGHVDRWPLLFLYSMIFLLILKRVAVKSSLSFRRALAVFLPLLPALVYLILMGQYSGMWAYGAIVDNSYLEASVLLRSMLSVESSQVQITIISLLRLDDIFAKNGFIAYAPLILIGLVSIRKDKGTGTNFLYMTLVMFLSVFLLFPQDFYPFLMVEESYIRRYMYFMPVAAILSSRGFYWIWDRWRSAKNREAEPSSTSLKSFILYNTLSMVVILVTVGNNTPYPLSSIFAIPELRASIGWSYVSILDLTILVAILFACLGIRQLSVRISKTLGHRRDLRKAGSALFISIVALGLFSTTYSLRIPLADISVSGSDTRYALPSGIQKLVIFFDGVDNKSMVIGFQKYYLATFSDVRVMDLSTTDGCMTFSDIFSDANLSHVVTRLGAQNAVYFVDPSDGSSLEHDILNEYRVRFPSFDGLLKSNYTTFLASTGQYDVYKILA